MEGRLETCAIIRQVAGRSLFPRNAGGSVRIGDNGALSREYVPTSFITAITIKKYQPRLRAAGNVSGGCWSVFSGLGSKHNLENRHQFAYGVPPYPPQLSAGWG